MQKIVLATDFGKASENAYRYCLQLASKKRSQIFIAHVYQQQTLSRLSEVKRNQHHQEEFDAFKKRIIRFGRLYPGTTPPELFAQCQVSTEIEAGQASEKLLKLAEKKSADFEKSLERLDELVEQMESGELSLEEMIKHFEEGSKLVEVCSKKLNEVEQKIEKLVKKDGELKEVPFEMED